MSTHPLDEIRITSGLFYARKAPADTQPDKYIYDGIIPIDLNISLGYRYYHAPNEDVLLFFHGNGEIASDYDMLAPLYARAGLALLVVDYRGYGWSDGVPLTTQLLPDALIVAEALPVVLAQYRADSPALFIKGRSLGSAPAVYVAQQKPELFKGLIIESGYSDAPSLFRRMGLTVPEEIADDPSLPLNNAKKMQTVSLPLLVIHGENDMLIPAAQGRALYDAAPTAEKNLVIIPHAGHNDLIAQDSARYFGAIREFVLKYA